MFAFLICILTLHQVHSACILPKDICPDTKAVQDEIVDQHNIFRRDVDPSASDMLKMSYSVDLANYSQAWVNKCNLTHGPASSRMHDGYELGENLYYSNAPDSWTKVISAWHAEVKLYSYHASANETTGHYVQIVWNSSYKVGCGVALCPENTYFYACQYFRAGNFKDWKPYTSGSPCALCPNDCEDKLCTNPCPHINLFSNCANMTAQLGCENSKVKDSCRASCECTGKIVPVY